MAISLGRLKQYGAKQATGLRLAKEYEAQQRKESKRKGWSSLLGGVGGKLLGAGIGSALGIASGGLLMPLIMGASSTFAKKHIDEASKALGYGADTSGLKGDKYGYGVEEAKTLREGLEEQMKTEDWTKSIGKDVAMSYISAGASGKLGGVKGALKGDGKQLWMGGEGDVIGTGEGLYAGKSMGKGFLSGVGEEIGLGSTFGGDPEDDIVSEVAKPKLDIDYTTDYSGETLMDESLVEEPYIFGSEGSYPFPLERAQGGLVPQSRTIADYFGMQGVSLGGSNKQSLAQMLGR